MARTCRVTVNKESFHAKCGDLLLDAALANGVDLPHDCRSGVCGSCRIRLEDGKMFGGYDGDSGMIYACRARVVSNMKVMVEPVPETVMVNAEVVGMRRMAPDIFAVDLQLSKKLRYLSGQYTKVQFRGFPERCYSPTYPLQGAPKDRLFHYHLRQVPGGLISTALGREIRVGHRVKLTGPFGSAFFRPKHRGRIVVVASGTGFAPMWSVATAAIKEWPQRELVFLRGPLLTVGQQVPGLGELDPGLVEETERVGGGDDRFRPGDLRHRDARLWPVVTAAGGHRCFITACFYHRDMFCPIVL